MMNLRELGGAVATTLRGIPSRPGPSLVIITALAGVVAVFICVTAMVVGFTEAAVKGAQIDRAIILSRAAASEAESQLSRASTLEILNAEQIRRDRDGKPIASAEAIAFVRLIDRHTQLDSFATLRGVGPSSSSLRPEIQIKEGRMFRPGLQELIVGRSARRRLANVDVGAHIYLSQGDAWTVVGVFDGNGSLHESEMLTDAEALLSSFQRNSFNSVTVLLATPDRFDAFKADLLTNPNLSVDVRRESQYFAEVAGPRAKLMKLVAYAVGGIMVFGAFFAALNASYSAVAARSSEVGTLRAIGFSGYVVLFSVLVESLLLACTGAVVGAAIVWIFFNNNSISTLSGDSPTPITYYLHITPSLIGIAMAAACLVGLLGGLMPGTRAATLPIARVIKNK